jgi:hypothetical protein
LSAFQPVSLRSLQLILFLALSFASALADSPLLPESRFASPEEFISKLAAFEPAKADTYFGFLFTTKELGQPEEPQMGAMTRAEKVDSCQKLFADDQIALVFALANPPTQATPTRVGVLFLLSNVAGQWRIADFRKFTAEGKESGIKMTFNSGYIPQRTPPTVMVTEFEGGRGFSQTSTRSYSISNNGIVPAEMR